eukprot:CAMPEP_0184974846 /NCGR_PEP_ID=MMETSP1098-20130426/6214_1 /TAXON_ID=89044 /ORGANISM="Spumella elongata, Strain CCAP 955/1" /LENGTH=819 /DNA_ID=CAMNT_0027497495 /DNA_START=135 /DNA_END=2594 /DNA_ORIENTATION=+
MPRHTDDQLLEVCKLCIAYLNDKHASELGLFRSSVAQTDVRALQSQIIQFSYNKFREDPDPHLVAEVLQTSFKNLSQPLLHEVYQDIVDTDLDDEDYDLSETSIQNWIVKLPKAKFNLASALFRLLSRLASVDESDSNLIQLAYSIAPTICRPINSAYMSIRHMEDLRKIRPVISFIMENYEEIFSEGFEPVSPVKFSTDASGHKVPSSFAYDKTEDISSLMSSSMMIDTGVRADDASITSMEESMEEHSAEKKDPNSLSPRSLELIRPNLKLTIPLTLPPSPAYSDMSSSALSQLNSGLSGLSTVTSSLDTATSESLSSSTLSSLQHYTDAEWSVLEAILLSTASAFLDLDSPRSSDAMQVDGQSTPSSSHGSPVTSRPVTPGGMTPPVPSSSSSSNLSNHSPNHSQLIDSAALGGTSIAGSTLSSKNRRRKMVADCKAMRVQIFEFEQDWTKKHNRIPKSFERGSMEGVYTRYRKLKKEIRDLSATDLQRTVRGYIARRRHGRIGTLRRSQSAGNPTTAASAEKAKLSSSVKRSDFASNFFVPPGAAGAASPAATAADSNGMFPGSNIPSSLYAAYRDLLEKKRDLKRRLKKFDEDFYENWGRNPKKSDKEVIRPMYQSYHEIKAKLDDLRTTIEASHGPLPEDLQDDGRIPSTTSTPTEHAGRLHGASDSAGAKYVSDDEGESDAKEGGNARHPSLSGLRSLSGDKGSPGGSHSGSSNGSGGRGVYPSTDIAGSEPKGFLFSVNKNPINIESELEALQVEKRNLHAYLKVYERDFSRMHGRPVTKHADIQPVAHEYQRYKELKNLIRDKKLGAGAK